MPVEIDIQLYADYQKKYIVDEISSELSGDYVIQERNMRICISFEDCTSRMWTLDEAIVSFLNGLVTFREKIVQLDATLRIGLFYQVSETIVCPVMLNRLSIKVLSQFNVDLNVSGYPCSNDE